MKIKILSIGKTNFSYLNEGIDLYLKRLKFYGSIEYLECHLKIPKSANQKEVKRLESKELIKHIQPQDSLVLLDERGKEFDSIALSKYIQNKQITNVKCLTIVIGGPYGFDQSILDLKHQKLSLSKLTFSHQMIRLFLVEQLYRSFTILKGEPYHHA